jgi:drug/metabolite transporter (DMT)-like permease
VGARSPPGSAREEFVGRLCWKECGTAPFQPTLQKWWSVMTLRVVVLALIASGFTATASVAQRRAAALAPERMSFSWRLVGYLLKRPAWFVGIASMILGFVFQVEALRLGSLTVVQPLIATELVIVVGVIAIHDPHRVHGRDWLSALGMVIGLGAFLALARSSGGHSHSGTAMWVVAGVSTFVLAGLLTVVAYLPLGKRRRPSAGRKAALLGIAAATGFGFVAAVIKELSSHLSQGPSGVFLNWSPYVLLLSGAAAMFLASNAFQAGSLAASQPGLTIVDPLVASALGVVLFGERLNHAPAAFIGEILAVALLVISVVVLSRSPLVHDEQDENAPASAAAPVSAATVTSAPRESLGRT